MAPGSSWRIVLKAQNLKAKAPGLRLADGDNWCQNSDTILETGQQHDTFKGRHESNFSSFAGRLCG